MCVCVFWEGRGGGGVHPLGHRAQGELCRFRLEKFDLRVGPHEHQSLPTELSGDLMN